MTASATPENYTTLTDATKNPCALRMQTKPNSALLPVRGKLPTQACGMLWKNILAQRNVDACKQSPTTLLSAGSGEEGGKLTMGLRLANSVAIASAHAQNTRASSTPIPEWYVRGVSAALHDGTPGMLAEVLRLPRYPEAFRAIGVADPNASAAAVGKLLKLLNGSDAPDPFDKSAAATALGEIAAVDSKQRKAVTDRLVNVADSQDANLRKSALSALAEVAKADAKQRNTVVNVLIRLAAKDGWYDGQAATTLGAIANVDPQQRKIVVDALVLLAARDREADHFVAAALGEIKNFDPEQRRTVVSALVKLASDLDQDIQISVAVALGAVAKIDPDQRDMVVH
jgi:hypothetical protein